jgi:hypothetical protein
VNWQEIHPIELHDGQRVRQAQREGHVLGWRWIPARGETVVDVEYINACVPFLPGDRTQWVVSDDKTITAWVSPEQAPVIVAPRGPVRE